MKVKFIGIWPPKSQLPFPDMLIIEDFKITYKRWKLIGYEAITIRRNLISGIAESAGLLFSDIVITSQNIQIIARGFLKKDIKQIKSLLNF